MHTGLVQKVPDTKKGVTALENHFKDRIAQEETMVHIEKYTLLQQRTGRENTEKLFAEIKATSTEEFRNTKPEEYRLKQAMERDAAQAWKEAKEKRGIINANQEKDSGIQTDHSESDWEEELERNNQTLTEWTTWAKKKQQKGKEKQR